MYTMFVQKQFCKVHRDGSFMTVWNLEVHKETCEKMAENFIYSCPLCIRIASGVGAGLEREIQFSVTKPNSQSSWVSLLTVLFGTHQRRHEFCGCLE